MEVQHKEVLAIPGHHLLCQELPDIVPEEVQVPEAHLAIEVQGPGVREAQEAIEVLEGLEVRVAIEVRVDLQDLRAA